MAVHVKVFTYMSSTLCRLHDLIQEGLMNASEGQTVSFEEEDEDEEVQYEYELDNHGERVVLGQGSFGIVYSALEKSTLKKMAIKEIVMKNNLENSG